MRKAAITFLLSSSVLLSVLTSQGQAQPFLSPPATPLSPVATPEKMQALGYKTPAPAKTARTTARTVAPLSPVEIAERYWRFLIGISDFR